MKKYLIVITVIFVPFMGAFGDKIRVLKSILTLAEDGKAISGAKLIDNRTVILTDLTICIRFNFKLLGGYEGRSRLISIEDWREDEKDSDFQLLWLGADYPHSFVGFGYPRAHGSYKSWLLKDPDSSDFEIWASNVWSHVCFAYSKATGLVRFVKDGKALNINYEDPAMKDAIIPEDFLQKVYIGRCSFDYKKTCSSPEGELADFNIWDKALSTEKLEAWTSCRDMEKGNLVDWTLAEFDTVNMSSSVRSTQSVCVPPRPGNVIFPERQNFTSHKSLCSKMRGQVSVIRSQETQLALMDDFLNHPKCGDPKSPAEGTFWTGWWDKPKEGVFSNVNDDSELLLKDAFQPWYYGEPNGDTLENCAVVWHGRNGWNDVDCNTKMCGFCELERSPNIQIRGLCDTSKFDTKYSWTQTFIGSRHSFRGYTDTLMYWDDANEFWRLELYSDPSVYAIANISEYPLGTFSWDFYGDACSEEDHNEVVLNINACKETEFNCYDGDCVEMNERCDGKVDCPDKTDEIGCEILITDASYLKNVPASPQETLDKDNATARAEVFVSIDLLSILEISEVDNIISMQLRLWMTWTDRRLTLLNLKKDQDLNTLTLEQSQSIWIPEVVFFNTKDKIESVNDVKAFTTIRRNGTFSKSPRSQLHNAYIFSGEDNPITISRVYTSDFICEFDMSVYPFDTQLCSVILIMKGNSGKFTKLVKESLNYLGPVDLTQYFVKDTRMSYMMVQTNFEAIKVDIVFGRRILAAILTTYLPTFLICLVSFSTNYFKAFFFEAIVTVNLTSLLVLTTLFISVSNALPKTAYIKFIDIWLIFNLFIPFAEVILHTYIDNLRKEDDRSVNHHGKAVAVSEDTGDKKQGKDGKILKPQDPSEIIVNGKLIKVSEAPGALQSVTKRTGSRVRPSELISRNEEVEMHARRNYYKNADVASERNMKIAQKIASQGLPVIFFAFVVVYFCVGIKYYFKGIDLEDENSEVA